MTNITIKTFEQHGEHYPVPEEVAARLPKGAVKEWEFNYTPLDTRAYLSILQGLPVMIEAHTGKPMAALQAIGGLAQPYVAEMEYVLAIEAALKEWKWPSDQQLPICRENIQALPYRLVRKLGNVLFGNDLPVELLDAYNAEALARQEKQKKLADEKNV